MGICQAERIQYIPLKRRGKGHKMPECAAPFVQIALKSVKKLATTYRLAQTNF